MTASRALGWSLICVAGVTSVCVGCYKPATGKVSGTAVSAPPASTEAPIVFAAPKSTPSATAAPSAVSAASSGGKPSPSAAEGQLAMAVDAALRNPVPAASSSGSAAPVDRFTRPAVFPTATAPRASRSPSRSPRTKVLAAPEASGGVAGITFDDLVFPIEKDQPFVETLLTDSVRALFDRKVKIRGYIHPSCPYQTGVTSFILVRDDQSCCFGPGAALYDCIIVDMVPGRTTNFTPKPIAVEGVLKLREFKDLGGKHLAIFHLDGESAE